MYRPTFNSKMRSLDMPFEQVNTEQIVRRIYSYVHPIDSALPAGSVSLQQGQTQAFSISAPQPQTHAMMNMGRAVAEAGAIAVVMHHPHVVSPLVVYETEDGRKVPIYASVGNLVSNQGESWTPDYPAAQKDRRIVYLNGWTRVGMIADLEIAVGARTTTLSSFGDHLVWVDNEHAHDKSNPRAPIAARLLDKKKDRAIIDKLARDAQGPRAIFDDPYWIDAISPRP